MRPRTRLLASSGLPLAMALTLILVPPRCKRPTGAEIPATDPSAPAAAPAPMVAFLPDRPAVRPAAAAPGLPRSPLADALNSPATTGRDDLRAVERILGLYRERFGAYPAFEDNAQLVNALAGANPARLGLLPRDAAAIDRASGALLDRWGTPYAFHPLSRTALEIRTAGPDRVLHTDDDLVARLGAASGGDAGASARPALRTDTPR